MKSMCTSCFNDSVFRTAYAKVSRDIQRRFSAGTQIMSVGVKNLAH